MSRYIDIEPYEKDGWYLQKHYHNSYGEVIKTTPLNCVPTAEPTKHGRWEFIGGYGYQYRCSVCINCAEWKTQFCPHCGARMDGVENE